MLETQSNRVFFQYLWEERDAQMTVVINRVER